MNPLALLSSVPLRSQPLKWSDVKLYLFSAVFAVGNLLVPLAIHSVPDAGAVFLPLFFFTLIAAWQFGLAAGLVVALVSPLLNNFLVGMPIAAMMPVVLTKSLALALVAVFLAGSTRSVSLWGLFLAVVTMQAVGFLAERVTGVPLAQSLKLFEMAVPGMLILLFGDYLVLRLLNGFLRTRSKNGGEG
jgi:hypothetical protein